MREPQKKIQVKVQRQAFDPATEIAALQAGHADAGALASFIGLVRDQPLRLEHYPGMTERMLEDIIQDAIERFDLLDARLIHRYGPLEVGEGIVLVLALAAHRKAALAATDFMMDQLKTNAPFWKQEDGAWVDERQSDLDAAAAWQNPQK